MISLILTAIAVVTIVPIVYFLPLGMTNKGKGLILFLALTLATLALVAKSILPIWELGLFLILLIVFGTYLLDRRIPTVLYQSNEPNESNHVKTSQKTVRAFQSEPPVQEDQLTEEKNIKSMDDLEFADRSDEVEPIAPIEVEQDLDVNEMDLLEREHVIEITAETNLDVDIDLEPTIDMVEPNIEEKIEELSEAITDNELEEIMLKELDMNEVAVADEKSNKADTEDTTLPDHDGDDFYLEALLDDIEEEQQSVEVTIPEDQVLENIDEVVLPLESVDLLEESVEEPVLEKAELEQETDVAVQLEELLEETEVQEEMVTDDVGDVDLSLDQSIVEEKSEQRSISYDLMQTMVEQLRLARNTLAAYDYEELIKDHLHADLTLTDYYTFATLLVEHYIEQNNTEQLNNLIKDLQVKYDKYPIIIQELQYFKELYC